MTGINVMGYNLDEVRKEIHTPKKSTSYELCEDIIKEITHMRQYNNLILSISVDKNSPRINKCIVVKSASSDIGSIKITLTFHRRRKTADRMAYPPVVPVAHIVDPDYMLKLLDSINLTPAA